MNNNSFTERVAERVQKITGLTGEPLVFVSGAAFVTAIIGKIPTKVDLYTYAGMSEHELDSMMSYSTNLAWANDGVLKKWFREVGIYTEPKPKAMIYAVAADLVLEGLIDKRERGLVKTLVHPQQIQGRKQFDGLLITLEYLSYRSRGLGSSLPRFLRYRYGNLHKSDSLRAFCEIIYENNPDSFRESYTEMIEDLVELSRICE
ncbi:hypothetical protein IJI64_00230 [Candidatus Saccharibacteria bacterium]|nr:hypothetical protein [Candidatus Saccharibacteria bacterium]